MKRRSFLASLSALVVAPLAGAASNRERLTLTDDGQYGIGPGTAALPDMEKIARAKSYLDTKGDPGMCPQARLDWMPHQRAYQFTEYSINDEGQLCYFSMLFDEDDVEDFGQTIYLRLPAVNGRDRPQDFIWDRAEVRGIG